MFKPKAYTYYYCNEYFRSARFMNGVYLPRERLWLIKPYHLVQEDRELRFLAVGQAGVDGIELGYRKFEEGIWAYYPIEQKFRFIAKKLSILVKEWKAGNISL